VILVCSGFMTCKTVLLPLGGQRLLPVFVPLDEAVRSAGDTRVPAATGQLLSWLHFVPLSHTLVFAPGEGWIDGLPQAGLGALGGWLARMSYAMLLGTAMLLRWRSGRCRGIRLSSGS